MNMSFTPKVRPISIAIMAMGGEGGGVLADWIVDLAEHGGYVAQATSVPGVAQRTGATIYYVELFARAAAEKFRGEPVLALVPVPGDVDIVIASELMEAGRAIQRGLVTPDRTTLIASTNRVFAMGEKIAMADGRVDDAALLEACQLGARKLYAFDMAAIAERTGSVISAVLFGTLAGARALPFTRAAFEATIRRGGIGVTTSLAAFAAACETAEGGITATLASPVEEAAQVKPAPAALRPFLAAIERDFPLLARAIVGAGLERVVDYQNPGYGQLFLDRLKPIIAVERDAGSADGRLLQETARQLALRMAYEDTIRVAELKIRPSRFARVRAEVKARPDQILEIAEFMHPRTQEIADTLPAALGRWIMRTGAVRRLMDRMTRSGKTVKTSSIRGFLLLYLVASLKPLRARSLRYQTEQRAIEDWLAITHRAAAGDYELAVEVAACAGLVKGYGETHERGRANFDRLMGMLPKIGQGPGAAARLAALREAANADDTGVALMRAIGRLEAEGSGATAALSSSTIG